MNAIKIVPFEPAHALAITLREADALDMAGRDMGEEAALFAAHPGITAMRRTGQEDEIIFCCGAVVDRGTATLWGLTSPACDTLPLLVTRTMRRLVNICELNGCHRTQALAHVDNNRSRRWLRRFGGFRVEGLMRSCGPDKQDRYLLARIVGPDARACGAQPRE